MFDLAIVIPADRNWNNTVIRTGIIKNLLEEG